MRSGSWRTVGAAHGGSWRTVGAGSWWELAHSGSWRTVGAAHGGSGAQWELAHGGSWPEAQHWAAAPPGSGSSTKLTVPQHHESPVAAVAGSLELPCPRQDQHWWEDPSPRRPRGSVVWGGEVGGFRAYPLPVLICVGFQSRVLADKRCEGSAGLWECDRGTEAWHWAVQDGWGWK